MDTNTITNPTPKARFVSDPKRVADHRSMVRSIEFTSATDMALMEYQRTLSQLELKDMTMAAGAHLRMLGAQEYLQVLRNLGEKPQISLLTKDQDNLNHRT